MNAGTSKEVERFNYSIHGHIIFVLSGLLKSGQRLCMSYICYN